MSYNTSIKKCFTNSSKGDVLGFGQHPFPLSYSLRPSVIISLNSLQILPSYHGSVWNKCFQWHKRRKRSTTILDIEETWDFETGMAEKHIQGDRTGYRAGNREKLSSTQAEPGQAINSAVAYFPSVSFATSCPVALYI